MVLRGVAWCCVVLRGAAWCCVVLRGAAWCCVRAMRSLRVTRVGVESRIREENNIMYVLHTISWG